MVSKILIENQQRFLSMFFSYNNRIRFARLPSSCNVLDDICEVDRSNGETMGFGSFSIQTSPSVHFDRGNCAAFRQRFSSMPAVARPCPVTRGRQVTRRGKSDPAPSCNNETMLLQSGSAVNASDVLWFYLRGILRGRCGNNSGTYPAAISACKYRISKIVGGARDNSDIGGVTAFRRNGITGGEGKQRFRSCLFHAGRSSALDVLPDQVPCKGCPGQLVFLLCSNRTTHLFSICCQTIPREWQEHRGAPPIERC